MLFKNLKKYFNTLLIIGNASRNMKLSESYDVKKLHFEGVDVNVYHMNDIMHSSGNFIAVVTEAKQIVVDDYFFELSEDSKKAVIFHELGHVVDERIYDKKFLKKYRAGKDINSIAKYEISADTYAIKRCGSHRMMYNAITEIFDLLDKHNIWVGRRTKAIRDIRLNKILPNT